MTIDPRTESYVAEIDYDVIKLSRQQISDLLNGHTESMFIVAEQYYTLQDFKKAMNWYQSAHRYLHPTASVKIGLIYYYGLGTTVNYTEAYSWFMTHLGNYGGLAEFYIGIMNEEGQGVKKNMESAIKWFEAAASYGYPEAQYRLGLIYSYKLHDPKAKTLALKHLEMAARQQHAGAIAAVKALKNLADTEDGSNLELTRDEEEKLTKKEKGARAQLLPNQKNVTKQQHQQQQQQHQQRNKKRQERQERQQMRAMMRERELELKEQTRQELQPIRNFLKDKPTDEILKFIKSHSEKRQYLKLVEQNKNLLKTIRQLERELDEIGSNRKLETLNDDVYVIKRRISKLEGIFYELGRPKSNINFQRKQGRYRRHEEEDVDEAMDDREDERHLYERADVK